MLEWVWLSLWLVCEVVGVGVWSWLPVRVRVVVLVGPAACVCVVIGVVLRGCRCIRRSGYGSVWAGVSLCGCVSGVSD